MRSRIARGGPGKTGARSGLPTEAEWECRRARPARQALFPWGDVHARHGFQMAAAVRLPAPWPVTLGEPTDFGLFGIATNVHEWCADWHDQDYYSRSPERNPAGPDQGRRRRRARRRVASRAARCAASRYAASSICARFELSASVVAATAAIVAWRASSAACSRFLSGVPKRLPLLADRLQLLAVLLMQRPGLLGEHPEPFCLRVSPIPPARGALRRCHAPDLMILDGLQPFPAPSRPRRGWTHPERCRQTYGSSSNIPWRRRVLNWNIPTAQLRNTLCASGRRSMLHDFGVIAHARAAVGMRRSPHDAACRRTGHQDRTGDAVPLLHLLL